MSKSFFGSLFSGVSSFFKGSSSRTSSRVVRGRNPGRGFIEANKFNKARHGQAGGYAAWTFGNIMNAHCCEDDIIFEFELDEEGCLYVHPRFDLTCYDQAYLEEYQKACIEAAMLKGVGVEVEPEDLIDDDEVEEKAYRYAEDLASMYINGDCWIPEDILDWAYYDISDHNN